MSLNYGYFFAEVDDATGLCLGTVNTSDPNTAGPTGMGTTYVEIPVYDPEYCLKYYNWDNGQWYEDAEFTIPWESELL